MQLIQSFIQIAYLTDNSQDVTAPFGELSDYSRSFAKDKGRYSKAEYPDVNAIVFSSTEFNNHLDVTVDHQDDMLKVANYISGLVKVNGIPLDTGDLASLIDDSLNIDDMVLINVNSIITSDDGMRCPDYVEWTSSNARFKLWFHDESFRFQYLDFGIEVTLPIESIDDLLRPQDEMQALLRSITVISQLQNDRPHDGVPTKALLVEHVWYQKDNSSITQTMYFGLNAYGQQAFSADEQRKALADYILENSSYNRIDWAQVFPSIFKTNEVYVIPAWDEVSLPNKTMIGALYSPILPVRKAQRIGNKYAFGYPGSHVDTHLEVMPIAFKSLTAVAIGSPTNTGDQYSIRDTFPKYAFIHGHSTDFGRIDAATQHFLTRLYNLVILAEHFTLTANLPSNVSQLERNGHFYLTTAVDGLSIIILTKLSYMEGEGYDYEPSKVYDFLGDHEC